MQWRYLLSAEESNFLYQCSFCLAIALMHNGPTCPAYSPPSLSTIDNVASERQIGKTAEETLQRKQKGSAAHSTMRRCSRVFILKCFRWKSKQSRLRSRREARSYFDMFQAKNDVDCTNTHRDILFWEEERRSKSCISLGPSFKERFGMAVDSGEIFGVRLYEDTSEEQKLPLIGLIRVIIMVSILTRHLPILSHKTNQSSQFPFSSQAHWWCRSEYFTTLWTH